MDDEVSLETYVPKAIEAERLGPALAKDGRIGIGTIYPQERLHVLGSAIFSEKIGIGKTNPKTALDVEGTVTATNFVGDGSGLTDLPIPIEEDPTVDKKIKTAISTALGAIKTKDGKVGIGTPSPSSELTVRGDLLVKGNIGGVTETGLKLIFDPANRRGLISSIAGVGGLLPLQIMGKEIVLATGSGTDRLVVTETGNVGIGKDEPTTALDVAGTVKATNFVGGGSGITGLATATTVSNAISAALGVGHNSLTANWDKNVTDDVTDGQVTNAISTALGPISIVGNSVGIGKDEPTTALDVVGSAKISGDLNAYGNIWGNRCYWLDDLGGNDYLYSTSNTFGSKGTGSSITKKSSNLRGSGGGNFDYGFCADGEYVAGMASRSSSGNIKEIALLCCRL